MITLLSTIFGFLSSMAPDILGMFKDKSARTHELALMEKQAQLGLEQSKEQRISAEVTAQMEEVKAIYDTYRAELTAKGFVAKLSGSVRPALTYAFFMLYASVKAAQVWLIMHPALPWQESANLAQALVMMWSEEDMALFAAIVAFWFGTRSIKSHKSRTS